MNRIRKFRKAAHMTQNRLATISGVARCTIGRLEETGGKPHRETAEKLAKVLGVSVDVLTGERAETYTWQDADSYEPEEEGYYLCACKRKHTKLYRFKGLAWRNRKWVDESMDGYITEYVDPAKVIWWSAIEDPPERMKRLDRQARISE